MRERDREREREIEIEREERREREHACERTPIERAIEWVREWLTKN